MTQQKRHRIRTLGLGMAAALLPSFASATTTVNVVSPATLVARGAGVLLTVEVTCDIPLPHAVSDVSAEIIQRISKLSAARGFGNVSGVNCDGTPEKFERL